MSALVAANAPYCGPLGGPHSYRPFLAPDGIGFLRPPRRFAPLNNVSRLVPVLRKEDHHPMQFFYYGDGCSDTFIRVSERDGIVAHDRLDALRQLARHRANRILVDKCSHQIEYSSVKLLPHELLTQSTSTDVTSVRSFVSGSGCLNEVTYQLMHQRGLSTLVLNFEAPGDNTDGTDFARKTEIIYLGTEFYDGRGTACTLHNYYGCFFCNNSVYSRATCQGRLKDLRRPPPLSPSRLARSPPLI